MRRGYRSLLAVPLLFEKHIALTPEVREIVGKAAAQAMAENMHLVTEYIHRLAVKKYVRESDNGFAVINDDGRVLRRYQSHETAAEFVLGACRKSFGAPKVPEMVVDGGLPTEPGFDPKKRPRRPNDPPGMLDGERLSERKTKRIHLT